MCNRDKYMDDKKEGQVAETTHDKAPKQEKRSRITKTAVKLTLSEKAPSVESIRQRLREKIKEQLESATGDEVGISSAQDVLLEIIGDTQVSFLNYQPTHPIDSEYFRLLPTYITGDPATIWKLLHIVRAFVVKNKLLPINQWPVLAGYFGSPTKETYRFLGPIVNLKPALTPSHKSKLDPIPGVGPMHVAGIPRVPMRATPGHVQFLDKKNHDTLMTMIDYFVMPISPLTVVTTVSNTPLDGIMTNGILTMAYAFHEYETYVNSVLDEDAKAYRADGTTDDVKTQLIDRIIRNLIRANFMMHMERCEGRAGWWYMECEIFQRVHVGENKYISPKKEEEAKSYWTNKRLAIPIRILSKMKTSSVVNLYDTNVFVSLRAKQHGSGTTCNVLFQSEYMNRMVGLQDRIDEKKLESVAGGNRPAIDDPSAVVRILVAAKSSTEGDDVLQRQEDEQASGREVRIPSTISELVNGDVWPDKRVCEEISTNQARLDQSVLLLIVPTRAWDMAKEKDDKMDIFRLMTSSLVSNAVDDDASAMEPVLKQCRAVDIGHIQNYEAKLNLAGTTTVAMLVTAVTSNLTDSSLERLLLKRWLKQQGVQTRLFMDIVRRFLFNWTVIGMTMRWIPYANILLRAIAHENPVKYIEYSPRIRIPYFHSVPHSEWKEYADSVVTSPYLDSKLVQLPYSVHDPRYNLPLYTTEISSQSPIEYVNQWEWSASEDLSSEDGIRTFYLGNGQRDGELMQVQEPRWKGGWSDVLVANMFAVCDEGYGESGQFPWGGTHTWLYPAKTVNTVQSEKMGGYDLLIPIPAVKKDVKIRPRGKGPSSKGRMQDDVSNERKTDSRKDSDQGDNEDHGTESDDDYDDGRNAECEEEEPVHDAGIESEDTDYDDGSNAACEERTSDTSDGDANVDHLPVPWSEEWKTAVVQGDPYIVPQDVIDAWSSTTRPLRGEDWESYVEREILGARGGELQQRRNRYVYFGYERPVKAPPVEEFPPRWSKDWMYRVLLDPTFPIPISRNAEEEVRLAALFTGREAAEELRAEHEKDVQRLVHYRLLQEEQDEGSESEED